MTPYDRPGLTVGVHRLNVRVALIWIWRPQYYETVFGHAAAWLCFRAWTIPYPSGWRWAR